MPPVGVTERVVLVAPLYEPPLETFDQVEPPLVETCHCQLSPVPLPPTEKVVAEPAQVERAAGCDETAGAVFTVTDAVFAAAVPQLLEAVAV